MVQKLAFQRSIMLALVTVISIVTDISLVYASENENDIDRFKTDFYYQWIGYQILSESEHTVAVTQDFDIDFADTEGFKHNFSSSADDNGQFIMSDGLWGLVDIPDTVYDEKGTAYTVVALAHQAIDYVGTRVLILPPTLEHLNGGIRDLPVSTIYLPAALKEIEGINWCEYLKNIHIPWNVEEIKDNSLSSCGFQYIYLPPSVKTLGKNVFSNCHFLQTPMLSAVETMDENCFSGCDSLDWANLPKSLHTMGKNCFNSCKNLKLVSLPSCEIDMTECFNECPSITCIELLASEPYPFPDDCFLNVNRNKCELLVPDDSVDKYMNARGWNEFYQINGISTPGAGAKAINVDSGVLAMGGNGLLKIINSQGESIRIATLDGKTILTTQESGSLELSLPSNTYIVSSENSTCKILVR